MADGARRLRRLAGHVAAGLAVAAAATVTAAPAAPGAAGAVTAAPAGTTGAGHATAAPAGTSGARAVTAAPAGTTGAGHATAAPGAGTGTAAPAAGNGELAPVATSGAFRGVAAAEGVRIGVTAVGAPVTNHVVDGASPIAQAAIDSTSGSSALASVAYPGDIVVTTPGLLAGVSGGQLSGIPPYPLMAAAGSTTTPEQRVEGPGSTMEATATDRRAAAVARSGAAPTAEAQPTSAPSSARTADGGPSATPSSARTADGGPAPAWVTSSIVDADDAGVVTSTAASDVTGVTIGPLTLGRVTAQSVVRRTPGAEPERQTSFTATGLAVEGTDVALTPAGLVVAGTTAPVSATALQPVLDAAGLSVRPLAAENTGDGVISAGLVVTRTQELPTAISPVTVTYVFGRALAAVSASALPPLASNAGAPLPADASAGENAAGGPRSGLDCGTGADATGDGTGTGCGPGAAGEAAGGSDAGDRDGLAAGDFSVPSPDAGAGLAAVVGTGRFGAGAVGGADSGGGSTNGAVSGSSEAAVGPGAAVGAAVPVRRVGSRLFDLTTIYLLLVAAATTAVAVIQFVRHAGVRLRWTSRPG